MITNACDNSIVPSTLPNLQGALDNWYQKVVISILTKSNIDFQLSETASSVEYMVVVQPFTTRQLIIKPEGQRAWNWYTIHVKGTDFEPCMDDVIFFDKKRYRIMQKFEWSQYGYTEIQAVEDFGVSKTTDIIENIEISEVLVDS